MNLNLPVSNLPNIGPAYEKRLKKLNVDTVHDLLYHFPFRYQDYSNIKNTLGSLQGETVTIIGKLTEIKNIYTKNRKRLTQGIITDQYGSLRAVWFNQHFLTRTLKKGMIVSLSGKIDQFNHQKALVAPEYEILRKLATSSQQLSTIHTGRLVPIYPETSKLSSKWLRSRIKPLLGRLKLSEFLPSEISQEEKLPELNQALRTIHFPDTLEEAKSTRYRFAFEELFLLQLVNLKRKYEWQQNKRSELFSVDQEKVLKFLDSLPFTLTNAQKKATKEILTGLQKKEPMNRLLEGDVGSGKTVVACIAAYITHLNGFQTAFMAPTEVLAQQHHKTIKQLLEPFGLEIALLTGSKKIKPVTSNQQPATNIFIGTHALLHNRELFMKLGLIVIDEQHRFGVEQRALLSQQSTTPARGWSTSSRNNQQSFDLPHILTMTATPIPRTLALTFYGDLDLSIIDEMPKGRQKVKTFVVPQEKRAKGYKWIENKIAGSNFQEQAFIIYPLIEESEHETMKDIRAATAEFEKLQKAFPKLKLGLLHGRLKVKEKDQVIADFQQKKIHILVSTSVVEVGIDIPSATIMIIENAERFGLAQLHQLRGRVGRSNIQSYCFLFTEAKTRIALKRLHALEKEHCGLKLAETDLKLRGPGEVFGTKQHGLPNLKVASVSDLDLIKKTKDWAQKIWNQDESLDHYPALHDKLEEITRTQVVPN